MQEHNFASLMDRTAAELVSIHNSLNPDKPLKSWKGKKSDLATRIISLQIAILDEEQEALREGDELDKEIAEEQAKNEPESYDEPIETDTNAKIAETKPAARKSPRTIQSASLELLSYVAYYEDKTKPADPLNRVDSSHKNARSVGLPYSEILELVHEEFPGCSTSYACLRWYAVHARAGDRGHEDIKLPQRRPRSKPVKR